MTIRLLDAQTIGQIAAGEVIERPVSVVKELVENALDAGATRIAVRIAGGGLTEIDVADDGSGIAPVELTAAVRRHATSKLRAAGDLQRIGTLGFRGEGLASIAAVAQLTLISRMAGAEIATAIDAHGEVAGDPRPFAAPPGTRAIVHDLFGNVPVRREYLRSPAAEFARISTWLASLSLAYPRVAFSLAHDGRETFSFAAADDIALRLQHVFGRRSDAMIPIDADDAGARIGLRGYVSAPGDDRPDRRAQMLFVNDRLLRSTLVSGAWSAAYRTFAMTGRHPYGVLFLRVAPDDVDPNVHPTKSDVRLRHGDRVVAHVKEGLTRTLRRGATERLERAISYAPAGWAQGVATDVAAWSDRLLGGDETADAGLRVLGQLDATYLLATDGSALVLVDQHAAHERIVYEELAHNAATRTLGEPLLIPYTFETDAAQSAALEDRLDALAAGGLTIEHFGERAFRITSTPSHTTHAGKTRAFDVGRFLDGLTGDDVRDLDAEHNVWASLACHSVTRAGETLSAVEMTTLVERLQRCANPMHCPHGRPTLVRLEPEQLARLFKRV